MPNDVFISYRREGGADTARLIRAELQKRGFSVFLDVENLGPSHFDESLLHEIGQCPNFVLILSAGSLDSCHHENDWLRKEIKHALTSARKIIPVLKDGFVFPAKGTLPPDLVDLPRHQAVEYSHTYFTATVEKLVGFLQVPARHSAEGNVGGASAVAMRVRDAAGYSLPPGALLGEYRLLNPLGRGGMGEVYLGANIHTGQTCALKVLPAAFARQSRAIERFAGETRALTELKHPHIVRVLRMGESDERYFLAMDYVEGFGGGPTTLEEVLRAEGGKIKDEKVVRSLALQISAALYAAHQRGLTHQALKPGNVLLQGGDAGGGASKEKPVQEEKLTDATQIKVSDFGLAKILGDSFFKDQLTRAGYGMASAQKHIAIGGHAARRASTVPEATAQWASDTVGYLSPEQRSGGEVTAQSDFFACGALLYRLLTGKLPEDILEPPSRSGVSRQWDHIIERCLKRNPQDRYASAEELHSDLEHSHGSVLSWFRRSPMR